MSIKLNIGAGRTRYEGFVNCDYDSNCNADYVFNAEVDPWPFEDNSVDEVRAYHIMEHLGEGYFHFLRELYRVCKDKTIIDIHVPHHRHDNFHHDPSHRRAITPYSFTLFNKEFNYGDTSSTSKLGILYDVDFRTIECNEILDGRFSHLGGYSREVIDHFAYTLCNVYVETRMKVQVRKCDPKEYKVMELYSTILNRRVSAADIEYYMNPEITVEQIEAGLYNSDEYKSLQGKV